MKILCDYHHFQALQSHYFLFEKRLGLELYFPFGLDWWEQGFWNIGNKEAYAQQFLGSGQMPNRRKKMTDGGVHYYEDLVTGCCFKSIELGAFKDIKFDFILSSFYDNLPCFDKLIKLFQLGAKHIFRAGNNWSIDYPVKNVLSCAKGARFKNSCRIQYYHPEFEMRDLTTPAQKTIVNIMNCMPEISRDLFAETEKLMPDWKWHQKGYNNRDGRCEDVLEEINDHQFTWQVKPQGDGYGFVAHQSIAHGRPLVTRVNDFPNMTVSDILENNISCIDISNKSPNEIARMLKNTIDKWENISLSCKEKFQSVVSFEDEANAIRTFFETM